MSSYWWVHRFRLKILRLPLLRGDQKRGWPFSGRTAGRWMRISTMRNTLKKAPPPSSTPGNPTGDPSGRCNSPGTPRRKSAPHWRAEQPAHREHRHRGREQARDAHDHGARPLSTGERADGGASRRTLRRLPRLSSTRPCAYADTVRVNGSGPRQRHPGRRRWSWWRGRHGLHGCSDASASAAVSPGICATGAAAASVTVEGGAQARAAARAARALRPARRGRSRPQRPSVRGWCLGCHVLRDRGGGSHRLRHLSVGAHRLGGHVLRTAAADAAVWRHP